MISNKNKQALIQMIAFMLIFLFAYTSVSKLINHPTFELALTTSSILKNFAGILSWLIPIVELMVVILLFIPKSRSAGLLASAILLTVFSCYIGYMLLFVPERACSCGGVLAAMTWFEHLLFNICFTLFSFIGYLFHKNKEFVAINRTSRTPVQNSRHKF